MGCLIALIGLGMAIGGGIGWAAGGAFLWWGVVCVIGIIILFCFLVALTKGAAAGEAIDLGLDIGDFAGFD